MSFWRIRIDCWSQASHRAKPKRAIRWFIVEGERDEAQKIALEYAENTAKIGPLWVKFEFREGASLKFPLEIA